MTSDSTIMSTVTSDSITSTSMPSSSTSTDTGSTSTVTSTSTTSPRSELFHWTDSDVCYSSNDVRVGKIVDCRVIVSRLNMPRGSVTFSHKDGGKTVTKTSNCNPNMYTTTCSATFSWKHSYHRIVLGQHYVPLEPQCDNGHAIKQSDTSHRIP